MNLTQMQVIPDLKTFLPLLGHFHDMRIVAMTLDVTASTLSIEVADILINYQELVPSYRELPARIEFNGVQTFSGIFDLAQGIVISEVALEALPTRKKLSFHLSEGIGTTDLVLPSIVVEFVEMRVSRLDEILHVVTAYE